MPWRLSKFSERKQTADTVPGLFLAEVSFTLIKFQDVNDLVFLLKCIFGWLVCVLMIQRQMILVSDAVCCEETERRWPLNLLLNELERLEGFLML